MTPDARGREELAAEFEAITKLSGMAANEQGLDYAQFCMANADVILACLRTAPRGYADGLRDAAEMAKTCTVRNGTTGPYGAINLTRADIVDAILALADKAQRRDGPRAALLRIADLMVEDTLAMTDEEVAAECAKHGVDMHVEANKARAIFERVMKSRIDAAAPSAIDEAVRAEREAAADAMIERLLSASFHYEQAGATQSAALRRELHEARSDVQAAMGHRQ